MNQLLRRFPPESYVPDTGLCHPVPRNIFPVILKKFPVLWSREYHEITVGIRGIGSARGAVNHPNCEKFPVNSHITGNLVVRPARSGLHRAPVISILFYRILFPEGGPVPADIPGPWPLCLQRAWRCLRLRLQCMGSNLPARIAPSGGRGLKPVRCAGYRRCMGSGLATDTVNVRFAR